MSGIRAELEVERPPHAGRPFRLQVELDIQPGITVVTGPSGSGKSTLLQALVGAIRPSRGRIVLDDRVLFDSRQRVDVPTRSRRVGLVLQNAPLLPHLDAADNVAFGLGGQNRRRRAGELLERLGAAHLGRRHAHELSGGETQRIALARALASRPRALLLDEPLSALDAAARESLGAVLMSLQRDEGLPFLHVTHDLSEALRLGSQLLLLDGGSVVQRGDPADVLLRPSTAAAMRIVGNENLFLGRLVGHVPEATCSAIDLGGVVVQIPTIDGDIGCRVALGLRAEDILLSLGAVGHTSARNSLPGEVESVTAAGSTVEVRVSTPVPFRVLVTTASVRELDLRTGRRVHLLIKATAFQLKGPPPASSRP